LILPLTFFAVSAVAQISPFTVSGPGLSDTTISATRTTGAFNSVGATTLVAFVSSHPSWPQPGTGLPVSIRSLIDNLGNTWNLLSGPTIWPGSTCVTRSAVYYVNAPIGANHTLTVTLTKSEPLVLPAFAAVRFATSAPANSDAWHRQLDGNWNASRKGTSTVLVQYNSTDLIAKEKFAWM